MFTGIVEEAGLVDSIQAGARSIQLQVRTRRCGRGLRIGDSLAVNGCCLTVVGLSAVRGEHRLRFDLLRETWNKTNLKELHSGARVNLERPLRANGRLDGHFVTGHIDGVGVIRRWEQAGQDWVLDVTPPRELLRYLVYKGSVAVDGISLTVAGVGKIGFTVWIIPHTYSMTALHERRVGDEVNLEADILAKYVERGLAGARGPAGRSKGKTR